MTTNQVVYEHNRDGLKKGRVVDVGMKNYHNALSFAIVLLSSLRLHCYRDKVLTIHIVIPPSLSTLAFTTRPETQQQQFANSTNVNRDKQNV